MLICLNFMNKEKSTPSLRDFGYGAVLDSTITSCRWHWLIGFLPSIGIQVGMAKCFIRIITGRMH